MSYGRYVDWLEEALDDLEAARKLFEHGMWSKVCFFSHQAAEKALKALCIKKLGRYVHTHSVARLLEELGGVVNLPLELAERAGRLDRHYIPTRYPNAWPELPPHKHYSRRDAEEALSTAAEVVELARREAEGDP
uniref:HEPN domain-containing protein n=1 Tax=Thermofilum pendens TaxID=2269 RepID=A0A7J3X7F5_THEPE